MNNSIKINGQVFKELEYMVELHQCHGASNAMPDVETLVGFVLASIADGSRRPDAWERGLLVMMGLVADCPGHHTYRSQYGKPPEGG